MYGKYEFNILPFGLASSPGMYQSMANKLIAGLGDREISYVDGILIYTNTTAEDHIRQVQLVRWPCSAAHTRTGVSLSGE